MSYAPGLYFVRDVDSPPYQLTTTNENGPIQTRDLKKFEIQGVKCHLTKFSKAFHEDDVKHFYRLLNRFSSAGRNHRTSEPEADELISSYLTLEDNFLGTFLRSLLFGAFVRVISYIKKSDLETLDSDLTKFSDACNSAFNEKITDRHLCRKAIIYIETKRKETEAVVEATGPLQFGEPSGPHQIDRTTILECHDSSPSESTLSPSLKRRVPPGGNQQPSAHKKPGRDEKLQGAEVGWGAQGGALIEGAHPQKQSRCPPEATIPQSIAPLNLSLPLHIHPGPANELPQYQIGKGDQETNLQIPHAPHNISLQARQELLLPSLQQNKNGIPSTTAQSTDSHTSIPLDGLLNAPGEIQFGYRTIPPDYQIARLGIFALAVQNGLSQNKMDLISATLPEVAARSISISIRVTRQTGFWVIGELGLQPIVPSEEDTVIMYTHAAVENLWKLGDALEKGIQSCPLRQIDGDGSRTVCISAFAGKFPPEDIVFTIQMGRAAGFTVLGEIGMECVMYL